ncbi:M28 family metallopeptidase [Azohydromonas caseinilytica]|uniref:M20/M25/M40 family metallo-hydrolase n=1 Tax=Azohydromonas caseinilytica TaxID=2728836 RepID=A0A848F8A5_9BURK|nr:M28 family metallopeptidase [Azohydromonas caseinilytica]NML14480.1 M20/M25/M40 family metallo-hydrolase [Azohydromonas caseinilytica]
MKSMEHAQRTSLARFPGWWPVALAAGMLAGCGGGGGDAASTEVAAAAATEQAAAVAAVESDAIVTVNPEAALPDKCTRPNRTNDTIPKLMECVTYSEVRKHQQALQDIANANNGTRASGTPGFDASARYAVKVFRDAGYDVRRQYFQFRTFEEVSDTVLQVVAPNARDVPNNILAYSPSGEVTAAVTALPFQPTDDTPGCEASDFNGFPRGHIALVGRGNCTFALKATNAQAAGAVGVIIANNIEGEINGTLGADFRGRIPVTSVTQEEGNTLAGLSGLRMRIKAETKMENVSTSNVIAESRKGDPDQVVMVGAHLDSVPEGPGINDNGSGVAAILETAKQLGKVHTRNKLRFALWGGEESGLVGATYYVTTLEPWRRDRIALYLNFDMIGSPNHGFFIYDGDNSDNVGAGPGPEGSAEIEKAFEGFYERRGIAFRGTDFDGRSDYGPFIAAGIPSGGLFTGAEGIKTEEEAGLWGGTAGQAYDPCYHQACDTFRNVNAYAFNVNLHSVAATTLRFAKDPTPPGAGRAEAAGIARAGSSATLLRQGDKFIR